MVDHLMNHGSRKNVWAILLFCMLACGAVQLTPPCLGQAQDSELLTVRLTPARTMDEGDANPYRYLLEFRSDPETEVVLDRRLLSLEIRPTDSRRRYRCAHPNRPRRVSQSRVQEGLTEPYVEWIDLRMYCWGRALSALSGPATVHATYGFRGRGRNSWVARGPEPETVQRRRPRRPTVARVALFEMSWPGIPTQEGVVSIAGLALRPGDAQTESGLTFRVSIRPRETSRIYMRDDLFRFWVQGPTGDAICEVPVTRINPIIDFFRRVGPRRSASTLLSVAQYCHQAFPVAGIYEVTPEVNLMYGGERFHFEALTGNFRGRPVPFRVRRGNHGYVEQIPGEKLLDRVP